MRENTTVKLTLAQNDRAFEWTLPPDKVAQLVTVLNVSGEIRELLDRISAGNGVNAEAEAEDDNRTVLISNRKKLSIEQVDGMKRKLSKYRLRKYGVDCMVAIVSILSESTISGNADEKEATDYYKEIYPGKVVVEHVFRHGLREQYLERSVDGRWNPTRKGKELLRPRNR